MNKSCAFCLVKRLLILVCTSNMLWLSAQTPDDIGPSPYEVQMLPASPEVAALGTFGDVPVNKYNGTANINIPIYTVKMDGLAIPLSATYNTGGIRVNQDATWVGLGWNLSDGITITREINGFDDLRDSGYSESIVPGSSGGKDNLGWIYAPDYLNEVQPGAYKISGANLENIDSNNWLNNFPIDFEPDLFTVSTPNGNCKFYLPKKTTSNILEGKIVNNVNFKVYYDSANFIFEVIDPDGFTYYFDAYELSTGYSSWDAVNAQSDQAAINGITNWSINQTKYTITAWKPTKIQSPMGRELNFSYVQGLHFSFPSFSETFSQQLYPSSTSSGGWYQPIEVTVSSPNVNASMNAFQNLYLTSISGDFGEVQFILGSERYDLFSETAFETMKGGAWSPNILPNQFNGKRLNNVKVFDHNNTEVLNAIFNYSYFNQSDINDPLRERYLRLKLDSITIADQQYEFSYFECDDLPAKDSKAIDLWGFYNGAITNSHRIPSSNRFYFIEPLVSNNNVAHEQFFKFNGADRKTNSKFAKFGLLNKVKYPTQGTTEYVYESHTVNLQKIAYTQQSLFNPDLDTRLTGLRSSLNSSAAYNFRYQYLKLQNDPSYSLYNYEYSFPQGYEDFEVGGLRVVEIIDKDVTGEITKHRQFDYVFNETTQSYSSGKLMDDLIFHSKGNGSSWEYTPENYSNDGSSNNALLHSNNMIRTTASAGGSHVGYSRVIEKTLDTSNNHNGYVISEFQNAENQRVVRDIACTPQFTGGTNSATCQLDYTCWDSIFSCGDYDSNTYFNYKLSYGGVYILSALPISSEYQNGKPMKEFIFDSNSQLVKQTQYTYEEVIRPGNVVSQYPLMNWQQNAQSFPIGHPYEIIDGNGFNANKEYRLQESTTTDFFDTANVINTTELFYGAHNQLIKVIRTDSHGELNTTKAYYPQDLSTQPFVGQLIDSNRTRIKIKSEVFKGTQANPEAQQLISQRITFSNTHNPSGLVLPYEVLTLKGDPASNTEQKRQVYEKYDAVGNLLQYRKEGGIPISHLWGYNNQLLIAEIQNATYQQIESVINPNNIGLGGLSSADKTALRNGLPSSMVKTIEYKPLVGVTKMTDPRDYETNYYYDTANRLEKITDANSKVLQEYKYNYADVTIPGFGCTSIPGTALPPLTVREGVSSRGATYYTHRVIASGGTGSYEYKWYLGVGSFNNQFQSTVVSTASDLIQYIGCDEIQYVKVVVTSGNETVEKVYINGNYPCLPGEDPNNVE